MLSCEFREIFKIRKKHFFIEFLRWLLLLFIFISTDYTDQSKRLKCSNDYINLFQYLFCLWDTHLFCKNRWFKDWVQHLNTRSNLPEVFC